MIHIINGTRKHQKLKEQKLQKIIKHKFNTLTTEYILIKIKNVTQQNQSTSTMRHIGITQFQGQ